MQETQTIIKKTNYLDVLKERVLVFDGAMGTMLQSMKLTEADFGGKALVGCNDALALFSPEVIASVHRAYLEAVEGAFGADVDYAQLVKIYGASPDSGKGRYFTRLTNGFSKKVENHAYAVALHMMYYNFVRIHKTLRVTPAVAAGMSDRLWEIGDIAALVDAAEAAPKKPGPYKKEV